MTENEICALERDMKKYRAVREKATMDALQFLRSGESATCCGAPLLPSGGVSVSVVNYEHAWMLMCGINLLAVAQNDANLFF